MSQTGATVRRMQDSDLEIIDTLFPSDDATKHQSRFHMHASGEADYLFAWCCGVPVGHVLLRWNGTLDEPVASNLNNCPHLEDLFVRKEHRSRGIGTAILNAAEGLVMNRGFDQIGLAVGTENANARKLYERMGYVEQTSFGVFYSNWVEVNKYGESKEYREQIVYLVKPLYR